MNPTCHRTASRCARIWPVMGSRHSTRSTGVPCERYAPRRRTRSRSRRMRTTGSISLRSPSPLRAEEVTDGGLGKRDDTALVLGVATMLIPELLCGQLANLNEPDLEHDVDALVGRVPTINLDLPLCTVVAEQADKMLAIMSDTGPRIVAKIVADEEALHLRHPSALVKVRDLDTRSTQRCRMVFGHHLRGVSTVPMYEVTPNASTSV